MYKKLTIKKVYNYEFNYYLCDENPGEERPLFYWPGFMFETIKVACENDDLLILDNTTFTSIYKKDMHGIMEINKHSIRIKIDHDPNNHWGRGLRYYCYSDKQLLPSVIKNHIQKEADKYGSLLGNINFDLITFETPKKDQDETKA